MSVDFYKLAEYVSDKIPGGLADNKKPSDFNSKALAKGVKVELEHTSSKAIATEIAMDHLTEDPRYYDKLEIMEKISSVVNKALKKLSKIKYTNPN